MNSHPVSFSVTRPEQFDRIHIVVRLVLLTAVAMTGMPQGGWFMLLLLLLPAFAAVQASKRGGPEYLHEDGPFVMTALHWLLGAYAYLALLTDKLPDRDFRNHVAFKVDVQGTPTSSTALWRFLQSIPSLVVLLLLGMVGSVLWLVAMFLVAVTGSYPAVMFEFQEAVLRYLARVLAYHASLVETYPVFTMAHPQDTPHDMGHPHAA